MTRKNERPMDAEVAWYPGDGNADPAMDDDGPGWVAFGRHDDGSLSYPMSHPAPRRTRDEAVALLDRVFTDDGGAVFIV
jgi:hypothetical protein